MAGGGGVPTLAGIPLPPGVNRDTCENSTFPSYYVRGRKCGIKILGCLSIPKQECAAPKIAVANACIKITFMAEMCETKCMKINSVKCVISSAGYTSSA